MGATRDHGNVFGAIPGERVDLQVHARADKQENKASLVRVIPGSESPHRVEPPCKAFGKCGGCAFMHIAPAEQTALKEQQLQDHFRSNGVALPAALSPAVSGRSDLGYRRKARLGVRHTARHGTLLGFRERLYPGIAGTESCAVLHPRVGGAAVFSDLRATIDALSCKDQVPQVEASVDDNENAAFMVRHLKPLTEQDRQKLTDFAKRHNVWVYLQPKGYDSVSLLWPQTLPDGSRPELVARVAVPAGVAGSSAPARSYQFPFAPWDFTQINREVNTALVQRALELLDLQQGDTVLDLFCGLGNITMPIAGHLDHLEARSSLASTQRQQPSATERKQPQPQQSRSDVLPAHEVPSVLGVDSGGEMVSRARAALTLPGNGPLRHSAAFVAVDLFAVDAEQRVMSAFEDLVSQRAATATATASAGASAASSSASPPRKVRVKVLADPPRSGLGGVLHWTRSLWRRDHPLFELDRLVYISCDPRTAAADAAVLTGAAAAPLSKPTSGRPAAAAGASDRLHLRLERLALADMFPHAASSESVALYVPSSAR